MAGNIAADNKFLPYVDAVLAPETRSLSGLIDTISALRDQALQSMRLRKCQHFCRWTIGHNGERNMLVGFYDGGKYLTSLREWNASEVAMLMDQDVKGVVDWPTSRKKI
jgi:hypothetical protein